MTDDKAQVKKTYMVPAVEQAMRIIQYLANSGSDSKNLTDISRDVGIHSSQAFSILNTLHEYGFVKKNPNRRGYVLGPGLLTITGKILKNLNLPRSIEPILFELSRKAEALVALGVISDDKTFVVAQSEGPGLGVSAPIGRSASITYGSHGKAIAAFLPQNELDELLKSKELFFYGSPDKYDESRLRKDLAQIRLDGFALDLGNMNPRLNAVSAPILDADFKPIGYITVVGFFSEKDAGRLGPLAADVAIKVSQDTGNMIYWKGFAGK
jgi:DNA-binding IclR family transcriptional regulator